MKFYFCRTEYLNLLAKSNDIIQTTQADQKTEIVFSMNEIVDDRGNILFGDMVSATMKALQKASSGLAKEGVNPFSEPVEFQFNGKIRGLSSDKKDVIVNINTAG